MNAALQAADPVSSAGLRRANVDLWIATMGVGTLGRRSGQGGRLEQRTKESGPIRAQNYGNPGSRYHQTAQDHEYHRARRVPAGLEGRIGCITNPEVGDLHALEPDRSDNLPLERSGRRRFAPAGI